MRPETAVTTEGTGHTGAGYLGSVASRNTKGVIQMRRVRNASFLVLCLALLQGQPFADEGCTAPGLYGSGSTEGAALQACDSDGQTHCSGQCQQSCGTDAWSSPPECYIVPLSSYDAAGYCNCLNIE